MMSHSLRAMLTEWAAKKSDSQWALAVIYKVEGHSYRKVGAMGLYNDQNEQLGILSGGCLEADIRLLSRKAISLDKPVIKVYDGTDESDMSFHLGCGGLVHIAVLPLTLHNQWLDLDELAAALATDKTGEYHLQLPIKQKSYSGKFVSRYGVPEKVTTKSVCREENGESWLTLPVRKPPHLLIAGGGIDAVPVCKLAAELDWRVSVWEPRPHYAPETLFSMATTIIRGDEGALKEHCQQHSVNMAMIMSHNLQLDASIVKMCSELSLIHVALLGPKLRKQHVLQQAGVTEENIGFQLHSPAGLDIGGELPQSIALSVIAQFHAALHEKLKPVTPGLL